MKQVLISHFGKSTIDKTLVNKICKSLWDSGIQPRRDFLKSPLGENSPAVLNSQLEAYDFVIAVLSPSYLSDEWLTRELFQSLVLEQSSQRLFVIPLLASDCEVNFPFQIKPIDCRDESLYKDAFANIMLQLRRPPQAFIIMKFGDKDLDCAYQLAIKPAVESFGYSALRIDEVPDSGVISTQILKSIDRSTIVIADMTGERPNCYFEAGYAFASKRELILTVREGSKIHFDLQGYRFIQWDTAVDLKAALVRRLNAIKDRVF